MKRSKIWGPYEEVRPLLKKAKRLFPSYLGHIRRHRIFLCGFYSGKCKHVAKITPNRYPWSLMIPDYDYSIEFHIPSFNQMSDAQKLYVVVHELWHIPYDGHKEHHKGYRKTVDHDMKDFKILRRVAGIDLEDAKKIFKGEKIFERSSK